MAQEQFEEYRVVKGTFRGWLLLIVFSLLVMGWGMFIHMMVPESPRTWDFGVIPDTPGISAYSTIAPLSHEPIPRQFEQLPEAIPWDRNTPPAMQW
jgi:hypothetical protein